VLCQTILVVTLSQLFSVETTAASALGLSQVSGADITLCATLTSASPICGPIPNYWLRAGDSPTPELLTSHNLQSHTERNYTKIASVLQPTSHREGPIWKSCLA
jgi:hypothetical protein